MDLSLCQLIGLLNYFHQEAGFLDQFNLSKVLFGQLVQKVSGKLNFIQI